MREAQDEATLAALLSAARHCREVAMGPVLQEAIGEARRRLGVWCPITCDRLEDPATDHEGNTYERAEIERWLEEHSTSPLTRSPLTRDQLYPRSSEVER